MLMSITNTGMIMRSEERHYLDGRILIESIGQ